MIDFIVNISINMAINVIQIVFRLNKTIPTLCFLLRFKRDSQCVLNPVVYVSEQSIGVTRSLIHTIFKKSLKIPKGGNQNPYIEEEQTTQWTKEKGQKDKQRSTKHTYKTKDRVTRTPLKTRGERRCSGRLSSSCSTSGTRRVNLVTKPVKSQGQFLFRQDIKFFLSINRPSLVI